jgi:hypothetical protein
VVDAAGLDVARDFQEPRLNALVGEDATKQLELNPARERRPIAANGFEPAHDQSVECRAKLQS